MKFLILGFVLAASCTRGYEVEFTDGMFDKKSGKTLDVRKFKIGDCIISKYEVKSTKELEEWEKGNSILYRKILGVGELKYHVESCIDLSKCSKKSGVNSLHYDSEEYHIKMPCPTKEGEIREIVEGLRL